MNYYNPYLYTVPFTSTPKVGLLSRIFGRGFSFSSLLDGTQRVLGVANQALPLVRQAKPIMSNAKTMLKIASEFRKPSFSKPSIRRKENNINPASFNNIKGATKINTNGNPVFFA